MFDGEKKTLGNKDKCRLVLKIKVLRMIQVIGSAPHSKTVPACPSAVPAPGYTGPADKSPGLARERRLVAGKNLQHDPQQKTG